MLRVFDEELLGSVKSASVRQFLDWISTRDEILALFLVGSRAQGNSSRHSDYDLWVLVDEKHIRGFGDECCGFLVTSEAVEYRQPHDSHILATCSDLAQLDLNLVSPATLSSLAHRERRAFFDDSGLVDNEVKTNFDVLLVRGISLCLRMSQKIQKSEYWAVPRIAETFRESVVIPVLAANHLFNPLEFRTDLLADMPAPLATSVCGTFQAPTAGGSKDALVSTISTVRILQEEFAKELRITDALKHAFEELAADPLTMTCVAGWL